MIAISQLLQALQPVEAAGPQPAGAAAKSPVGGIAQFFGAILEQARVTVGGHSALKDGGAVLQVEPGADVPVSENADGDEVVARDLSGLPIEHAASVLEALGKFETLPIEHAISVLEGLRSSAEAALVEGGEDSIPDDSEIVGDSVDAEDTGEVGEVAIPATATSVDEVVGELLAAMSAVPVQVVLPSENVTATPAPALALQPGQASEQSSLGTLQRSARQSSGLPLDSALLGAVAKSAIQETQTADPRPPGAAAPAVVEGGAASRPSLSEVFARAITRQQGQPQSSPGVAAGVVETPLLESLEALLPSVKPHGAPAQALVLPGPAEGVLAAMAPKGDAAVPQSIPERPPPEVVQVRQLGDFTVKTVRYLASRGEEVVTVRLVPRSLGELHISVRRVGQSLEVVMTAATHAARDAIEAQLPGLREALGRGGLDVINVTVQTSTSGDQSPGHSATSGHATGPGTKFTGGREEPEADPRGSPRGRAEHEGSLNMFV